MQNITINSRGFEKIARETRKMLNNSGIDKKTCPFLRIKFISNLLLTILIFSIFKDEFVEKHTFVLLLKIKIAGFFLVCK